MLRIVAKATYYNLVGYWYNIPLIRKKTDEKPQREASYGMNMFV